MARVAVLVVRLVDTRGLAGPRGAGDRGRVSGIVFDQLVARVGGAERSSAALGRGVPAAGGAWADVDVGEFVAKRLFGVTSGE